MRERLHGEGGASRRFAIRMIVSVVATLVVMGVLGNVLISGQMRDRQIDSYAATQRADVLSFHAIGLARGTPWPPSARSTR